MKKMVMVVLYVVLFAEEYVLALLVFDNYVLPKIDTDVYNFAVLATLWLLAVLFSLGLTLSKMVASYQSSVSSSSKGEKYRNMLGQHSDLERLQARTSFLHK